MMINCLCAGVFSTILYVILAVVILLLMVMIHELGHYVVGRILKFKINEFSIGFGKAIFSKVNKRGEKISLRIFPLGGYCAFAGEDGEEEKPKEEKNLPEDDNKDSKQISDKTEIIEENLTEKKELLFSEQKPWKRILVYFAGVTFNFISAIIFSLILLLTTGYDIQQVETINTNYAQEYLQVGDVIYEVDGKKIDFANGDNLPGLISEVTVENDFTLTVKRNGEMIEVICTRYQLLYDAQDISLIDDEGNSIFCKEDGTPITLDNAIAGEKLWRKVNNAPVKVGTAGFSTDSYRFGFWEALLRCIPFTFGLAFMVLKTLWLLITFRLPISDIGGPVSTISFIASSAQTNISSLLVLIPLIAANLAVFNILPFPALDGSHVVFTTIEWIRGKPINRNVESYIHFGGLVFLFAFIIIVDIIHFVS